MNSKFLHKDLQVRDRILVECGQVWCLREDIEKEEQNIETLIQSNDHIVEIVLAQQEEDSRRHNL